MNKATRQEMFERLRTANPHPTTELNYSSPFELLIAVLLSAQATDVGVNKATAKLFAVANTPQTMLDLGLEGVMQYTRSIGLYRTKSKHIIETCQALINQTPRRSTPKSRRFGSTRRSRAQNRQCGFKYGFQAACYGCGHAYFPRFQPHRAGKRQKRT